MARTKHNGHKKHPGGRPPLYDSNIHPTIAKECARHFGDTEKELARALSVSPSSISVWKRDYPEFKEAVDEGVMEYDCGPITNALRECCLGDEWDEVKREFFEIEINGNIVHCCERKVQVNGDGMIVTGLLPGDEVINGLNGKNKKQKNPYIYNINNRGVSKGGKKKNGNGKTRKNAATPKLINAVVLVKGEKVTIVHKKKHPDPVSIFFWLQNRKSALWKNVQRQVVESTSTVNHRHEHVVKAAKHVPRKELERFRDLLNAAPSEN